MGISRGLGAICFGIRRGESNKGRNAAADVCRVGVGSVYGRADEEPACARAESIKEQCMVEQLEEEIRGKKGDPTTLNLKCVGEAIKPGHVDGNACADDNKSRGADDIGEIAPGGVEESS